MTDNSTEKTTDEESTLMKLQNLLNDHCVADILPTYPPTRETSDNVAVYVDEHCHSDILPTYPPTRETFTKGDVNDDSLWTQDDTDTALQSVQYDTFLGLKLYHTNPIDHINKVCKETGKMFIDYEFCVSSNIKLDGESVTPGIITQLNVEDFANSGVPKRVKRIKHYMDKARCSDNSSSSEWVWVRGSEMPGRKVFATTQSICSQNVIQGKVGNCGFCSGFASLAQQFPHLVLGAFGISDITQQIDISSGAYSICIYPYGGETKRYLLLDDHVLCTAGTHSSPALSSNNENDLWIRFFEKVFVKLQSSYASLDGYYKFNSLYRHPLRAMQLITGSPIALELHYKQNKVEEVYETLLATEGSCCRVAHGRKAIDGLFTGHGYSLLWVGSIAGIQLACVRNPHGNKSYTGEFGRGSTSWITSDAMEFKRVLSETQEGDPLTYVKDLLSSTEDNGIFLIRFEKFVEYFPIVSIVGPIKESRESKQQLPEFKNCLHRLQFS